MYPNLMKEKRRMSTCNRLALQILGSQPVTPQNFPDHCPGQLIVLLMWDLNLNSCMEYILTDFT